MLKFYFIMYFYTSFRINNVDLLSYLINFHDFFFLWRQFTRLTRMYITSGYCKNWRRSLRITKFFLSYMNYKMKRYGVNFRETVIQQQEKQRELTNLAVPKKAFNKGAIPLLVKSFKSPKIKKCFRQIILLLPKYYQKCTFHKAYNKDNPISF